MVFITGDVHGTLDVGKLNSKNFKEGRKLTKSDYVIIAGDFGGIWDVSESGTREQNLLDWYASKGWTTLFIDGNHENFDRLYTLPEVEMFGSAVGKVNDSIFHLKRGNIYTIQGKTFFTFGGGLSIDKARRRQFVSWWPQEAPRTEEYQNALDNLEKVNWNVDYIITHTCSNAMKEELAKHTGVDYVPEYDLNKFLDIVEKNASFSHWYFAHFHEDIVLSDTMRLLYEDIVRVI